MYWVSAYIFNCLSCSVLGKYSADHLKASKPIKENKWLRKSGLISIIVSKFMNILEILYYELQLLRLVNLKVSFSFVVWAPYCT